MSVTVGSDDGELADHTDATVIPLSQPSERAQAELFVTILRREVKATTKVVAKAEGDWRRRRDAGDDVDPPARLVALRQRVADAEQMIKALNTRFLS
jgi:hypothetical protein